MGRRRQRRHHSSLVLLLSFGSVASVASVASLAAVSAAVALSNLTRALRADRLRAEEYWRRGHGLLWFQHYRRGGGTSLCHLLRAAVPAAHFLEARGEACQPEEWKLRDAMQMAEHNVSLLAAEFKVLDFNAFAQEYGPVPGPLLAGSPLERSRLHRWIFVANLRDPWSRFWSQLRYEMAVCTVNNRALSLCVNGKIEWFGQWWSPTSHEDSVLGVPEARLSSSPEVYADNYYTRILLNRTDMKGPPLTDADFLVAKALLTERFSAVIIAEEFAHSGLQLACSLGLDLEIARPLLRTRVRPYSSHESMMSGVPTDESELGSASVSSLKTRFIQRNLYDYTLYAHARKLSRRRLESCTRLRGDVRQLRHSIPAEVVLETTTTTTVELSIDDLFGCTNGRMDVDEDGQYVLYCPRSAQQQASSWWGGMLLNGQPKRELGQPIPGKDCWRNGFSWQLCCATHFGPKGNTDCWDGDFTHQRCCATA
uniref:Uncharacterized protein n=1 Tax=Pfiesteria piscicida TaxID=71001 RepID=A3E3S9_PFIPI|nr:unknown [Pfiesteria piscicida]